MINDSVKEELRPRLIEYVSQITTPSRKAGKNMFVCPFGLRYFGLLWTYGGAEHAISEHLFVLILEDID